MKTFTDSLIFGNNQKSIYLILPSLNLDSFETSD